MKTLIYDLETGGINAFKADLGMMLCFGYKWLGSKETTVLRVSDYKGWFKRGIGINDKPLLQASLKIMEQADLLVAHYGDKFDRRFLQGRCVMHGLTPPPPTKQRDTWRIARTAFTFSSNRLQALALALGLSEQKYQKTREEWPGWWFGAMAGGEAVIHDMGEYCKQDVRTLEGVYLAIRKYDYPHPRMFSDRSSCKLCGGPVQYHGSIPVGQYRYRRFQCSECGTWDRETKALKGE